MARVGMDIVETSRMRDVLFRTSRFKYRVFTDAERAWCDARPDPASAYAGCFAARQATLKALGCGWFGQGIRFADVSVSYDAKGRPTMALDGAVRRIACEQGVTEVFVSIAHTRGLAVANAVAATADSVPRRDEKVDERAVIAEQFRQARALFDDLDRAEGSTGSVKPTGSTKPGDPVGTAGPTGAAKPAGPASTTDTTEG